MSKYESPYKNIKQAAAYLGVHRDTIKGFIDDGELRAGKLRRLYRIHVFDLDRLVKDNLVVKEHGNLSSSQNIEVACNIDIDKMLSSKKL